MPRDRRSRSLSSKSSVSDHMDEEVTAEVVVRIGREDVDICASYVARALAALSKNGAKADSRKRSATNALLGVPLGAKRSCSDASVTATPRIGALMKNLPTEVTERGALFYKLSELEHDRSTACLYEVSTFGVAKVLFRDGTGGEQQLCKYSYKKHDDDIPETRNFETTEAWSYHVIKRCHKVYKSGHSSTVLSVLVPDVPAEQDVQKLLERSNTVRDGELSSLEALRMNNLNHAEATGVKTVAEMAAEAGGGDELHLHLYEDLDDPDEPCLDIGEFDPNKHTDEITADQIPGPSHEGDPEPADDSKTVGHSKHRPKKTSKSSKQARSTNKDEEDDQRMDSPCLQQEQGRERSGTSPSTPPSLHGDDMARATVLIDEASIADVPSPASSNTSHSTKPPAAAVRISTFEQLIELIVRGVVDKAQHEDELSLRRVISVMFADKLHTYFVPSHPLWEYIRWYSNFAVFNERHRDTPSRSLRCALCQFDHSSVVRCVFERTLGAWSDPKAVHDLDLCNECAALLREHFTECHDYVSIFDALAMKARKQLRRNEGTYSDKTEYLLENREWANAELLIEPLKSAIQRLNEMQNGIDE